MPREGRMKKVNRGNALGATLARFSAEELFQIPERVNMRPLKAMIVRIATTSSLLQRIPQTSGIPVTKPMFIIARTAPRDTVFRNNLTHHYASCWIRPFAMLIRITRFAINR